MKSRVIGIFKIWCKIVIQVVHCAMTLKMTKMKLKRTPLGLFTIVILAILVHFNSAAIARVQTFPLSSNVIRVPSNYTRIQWAIGNSTPGDTILVASGTYKEQIVIDKPLTIIGENRNDTIIDGNGGIYAVKITSGNVSLNEFTIQNATTPGWGGLWIDGQSGVISNVTISNCTITKSACAVWFNGTVNNVLRNNEFTNNSYDFSFSPEFPRFYVQNIDSSNKVNGKPVYWWVGQHNRTVPVDGGVIAVINSTDITVKNVVLSHNGQSVLFVNTNSSVIENVTSSNSDIGLYVLYSYNNTILNNTVYNASHFGISLQYSNRNTLSHNIVTRCSYDVKLLTSHQNDIIANLMTNSTAFYGLILTQDSLYNYISDNIVRFNQWAGIALDKKSRLNTVARNLIEFNKGTTGGLELADGSSDNLIMENTFNQNSYGITSTSSKYKSLQVSDIIYKNNFLNNTVQVYNLALPYNLNCTWDNGAEGNYWSNFVGTDANRDGISDNANHIDTFNVDRYPLMEPWSRNRTFAVNGTPFSVNMVTNSTIGDFNFNSALPNPHIAFNVTGPAGAKGFCNVTIPKTLLNVSDIGQWAIIIDGILVTPTQTIRENVTYTFFYLTYDFTTHRIRIEGTNAYPEFTVQAILLLTFFFATLSVGVLARARKKTWTTKSR